LEDDRSSGESSFARTTKPSFKNDGRLSYWENPDKHKLLPVLDSYEKTVENIRKRGSDAQRIKRHLRKTAKTQRLKVGQEVFATFPSYGKITFYPAEIIRIHRDVDKVDLKFDLNKVIKNILIEELNFDFKRSDFTDEEVLSSGCHYNSEEIDGMSDSDDESSVAADNVIARTGTGATKINANPKKGTNISATSKFNLKLTLDDVFKKQKSISRQRSVRWTTLPKFGSPPVIVYSLQVAKKVLKHMKDIGSTEVRVVYEGLVAGGAIEEEETEEQGEMEREETYFDEDNFLSSSLKNIQDPRSHSSSMIPSIHSSLLQVLVAVEPTLRILNSIEGPLNINEKISERNIKDGKDCSRDEKGENEDKGSRMSIMSTMTFFEFYHSLLLRLYDLLSNLHSFHMILTPPFLSPPMDLYVREIGVILEFIVGEICERVLSNFPIDTDVVLGHLGADASEKVISLHKLIIGFYDADSNFGRMSHVGKGILRLVNTFASRASVKIRLERSVTKAAEDRERYRGRQGRDNNGVSANSSPSSVDTKKSRSGQSDDGAESDGCSDSNSLDDSYGPADGDRGGDGEGDGVMDQIVLSLLDLLPDHHPTATSETSDTSEGEKQSLKLNHALLFKQNEAIDKDANEEELNSAKSEMESTITIASVMSGLSALSINIFDDERRKLHEVTKACGVGKPQFARKSSPVTVSGGGHQPATYGPAHCASDEPNFHPLYRHFYGNPPDKHSNGNSNSSNDIIASQGTTASQSLDHNTCTICCGDSARLGFVYSCELCGFCLGKSDKHKLCRKLCSAASSVCSAGLEAAGTSKGKKERGSFCAFCNGNRSLFSSVSKNASPRTILNHLFDSCSTGNSPVLCSPLSNSGRSGSREGRKLISAVHLAAKQNNEPTLSMLLRGEFLARKDRLSVFEKVAKGRKDAVPRIPLTLHRKGWVLTRDGLNAFDYTFDKVMMRGAGCSGANEALILLSARGCRSNLPGGDKFRTVEMLNRHRIEAFLLLQEQIDSQQVDRIQNLTGNQNGNQNENQNRCTHFPWLVDSPLPWPSHDISLGAENRPIPWENTTGDGAVLTTENFSLYVVCSCENDDTSVDRLTSIHPLTAGRKKLMGDRIPRKSVEYKAHVCGNLRQNDSSRFTISDEMLRKVNHDTNSSTRYECNFLCTCVRNAKTFVNWEAGGRIDKLICGNQRLREGVIHDLVVFRTPDGRGWGLKTGPAQYIEKGEVILGYTGQYFNEKTRDDLSTEYSQSGHDSYLMDLKPSRGQKTSTKLVDAGKSRFKNTIFVNATKMRNASAFINHTCSNPNVKLFHTLRDHKDTEFVHVGFEAETNILPDTELLFNYGDTPSNCRCEWCMKNE